MDRDAFDIEERAASGSIVATERPGPAPELRRLDENEGHRSTRAVGAARYRTLSVGV